MIPSSIKKPRRRSDLLRIAERVGTPVYVYEPAVVRERIGQLRQALEGLPVKLLYAMKANPLPAILEIAKNEGLGLECVSPAEVALAIAVGLPRHRIFFSPNNITDEEMHEVNHLGIRFNIGEFSRLEKYASAYPGSDVSIRLNPAIGSGHHRFVVTGDRKSKFGIPVGHLDRVRRIAREHRIGIVGLHQHIGSGIESLDKFGEAMDVLLEAARMFSDLRFLNFGGGLDVPYRPGDAAFDVSAFRKAVHTRLSAFRPAGRNPSFWFEPGRFLVAESGTLLCRVNTLKDSGNSVFAGVDTGFNHLIRPVLYGAYHAIYNLSNFEGPARTYDVVGNVCESGDILAQDREIQELREGDVLAVLDAGAYGMSMASEYNLRPLPSEVILEEDGTAVLVHRRPDTATFVDTYLSAHIGSDAIE